MYIKYDENNTENLKDGKEYICVSKTSWITNCPYFYHILTYYSEVGYIDEYDFDGKGFYDYDSEYGDVKRRGVIAYKEIEEYNPEEELE